MEFWRTIRSPTVERGRTDAQSVKSQSRKVVIWDLICLFTLVRSPFNCQIQIKNMHYSINRGRNETRNYCLFLPLYAADAHQDFHMRIDAHGSAYAHHPHEPHGSATAWPSLVANDTKYGLADVWMVDITQPKICKKYWWQIWSESKPPAAPQQASVACRRLPGEGVGRVGLFQLSPKFVVGQNWPYTEEVNRIIFHLDTTHFPPTPPSH